MPGVVMSFSEWVLQLAIGLSFGLLLFLLASGFTLTFGLARFLNLGHGAVFLVAAYVATAVGGFGLGLLAAAVTGVVLSLVIYGLASTRWGRIGSDELSQVLLTFGVISYHWSGSCRLAASHEPIFCHGPIPSPVNWSF